MNFRLSMILSWLKIFYHTIVTPEGMMLISFSGNCVDSANQHGRAHEAGAAS